MLFQLVSIMNDVTVDFTGPIFGESAFHFFWLYTRHSVAGDGNSLIHCLRNWSQRHGSWSEGKPCDLDTNMKAEERTDFNKKCPLTSLACTIPTHAKQ